MKSSSMGKVNTQTAKHLLLCLYTSHKHLLLHMVHFSMIPQQRALVDATVG